MPVDMCQPPAGKRSLTRTSGASSFDIFRCKDVDDTASKCSPKFATRVCNDSVVENRNPFLEAAHQIHEDVPGNCTIPRSGAPHHPDSNNTFLRGRSHIRFGECMTPEEADAALVRRPGSACKQRDLTGHHIFDDGPTFPGKENCSVDASSDITGCYTPKRPCSSSKTQELAGHNVFAFSEIGDMPPPPPRVPYMPQERVIPPHNMHRNPRKFESHMLSGAPVCVPLPPRPQTCPKPSSSGVGAGFGSAAAIAEAARDCGTDVQARARLVEEAKTRAFQGNHIFEFDDAPRNAAEDEEHFSLSKLARRRDIRGNNIFGQGGGGGVGERGCPPPCGKRHVGPCCTQESTSWAIDPQALAVNDPARYARLGCRSNTIRLPCHLQAP